MALHTVISVGLGLTKLNVRPAVILPWENISTDEKLIFVKK